MSVTSDLLQLAAQLSERALASIKSPQKTGSHAASRDADIEPMPTSDFAPDANPYPRKPGTVGTASRKVQRIRGLGRSQSDSKTGNAVGTDREQGAAFLGEELAEKALNLGFEIVDLRGPSGMDRLAMTAFANGRLDASGVVYRPVQVCQGAPAGFCPNCKGTEFWRSDGCGWVCRTCYPPLPCDMPGLESSSAASADVPVELKPPVLFPTRRDRPPCSMRPPDQRCGKCRWCIRNESRGKQR